MRTVLALLLGLCAGAAFAQTPPGPVELAPGTMSADGYRLPPYRAATPAHHPEAVTVDAAELRELLAQDAVLALDVMATVQRPPAGELAAAFIPSAPREHIPGSYWLPNVGFETLAPAVEAYLRATLARLSGGRPDRGLAFYCIQDCWASWNAARRAARLGYTRVYWFPGGTEGWVAAGGTLVPATPEPLP